MVTGPQQERLRTALTGATHEVVSAGATEWTRCADLLGIVGAALTRAADAEKDLGGETGPAMGAAFRATATGMAGKATDLRKGSEALALASNAIIAAGVGSSDMNRYFPQEPNPGNYTPPPGPRSDKDLADEAEHTQAVTDFNTSFESRERIAKQWADRLDNSFANSTATMKEIHGERDKTGDGGGGGGGGGPRPISTSPGGTPGRPPSGSPNDPPKGNPTDPPTGNPTDPPTNNPTDPPTGNPTDPPISTPPISTPPVSNPTVPPVVDPWNPALPTAEPSVIGTSGTAPSPAGLPGGATTGAIGGVAAGGLAGAAVGGIRGGFVPSGSASAGAPTTRPIGTSGRTGSSGSLGRGGASSTGSPTTRQSGRAAGRGASAGGGRGRGAASPGGGAGRRGAAGAGGGGRRGAKDKDQQSGDRDLFDDGQDWIDDAEAAPGVIG